MRTHAAALLILLVACQRTGSPLPDAGTEWLPAAAGETIPASHVAWDPPPSPDRDLGIGLVYFPMGTAPVRETLQLRALPKDEAAVVGVFTFSMPANDGWTYDVIASDGTPVRPNLVEHGYEESGLPFDSLSADGRWARVVFGFDDAGRTLRGWAELSGSVQQIVWRDWLAERATFFLDPASAQVVERPGGAAVDFPLERSGAPAPYEFDHHIEVDSVAGDWVRVRVVTPSDACGPSATEPRRTTVWTRYVDEGGRPLVWFYSRGC